MLDALASVFGPAVPQLVGTAAEKVFERKLGQALEDRDERRKTVAAYREAIEEWLVALLRNFQSLDFDDDELRHLFHDYIPALERFLADEEVSEELLRPFTEPTPEPRLDAARLRARWQALGLPDLPEDFNARGACTAYVKALTKKRIVTDELRALHQAQVIEDTRQLLGDLRGAWPEFDLDQYARRAHQLYRTIDLTALTPAGRDDPDERGPQLRDVFVPHSARRGRPPHSLPRDYLLRQGLDPDEEAARARLLLEAWSKAKREPILDLITLEQMRDGYVLRHCEDDSWHEVIRLLTAQLRPHLATPLVAVLTPEPSAASGYPKRLGLAFECLTEREPRELPQFRSLCDLLLDALYACLSSPGTSWPSVLDEVKFCVQVREALGAIGTDWPNPALSQRHLPRPSEDSFIYIDMIIILTGSIWSKLSETKPLLLDRARNDGHQDVRQAALGALAEHFRDAPETKPLLLDRARQDAHQAVRQAALLGWAQAYSNERSARLLSRDLDGIGPGLDPREPVGTARVEQAANRLGLTQDEVRAAYEELAQQVPLRLTWQPETRQRRRRRTG